MAQAEQADFRFSDHLELIAQMSRDFVSAPDIEAALMSALQRIVVHVGAEGGALFLNEPENGGLICHASFGPVNIVGLVVPAGQGIVGRSVLDNRAEIVRDTQADPSFFQGADQSSGFVTRSILCAPMSVKDERLGAIELVNKRGARPFFAEADLAMLEALAGAAALAIVNARMSARLVEQERFKRELELASEIQRSLLPIARPLPFPVAGANRPARTVSGDFYDFLELPDGGIAFCIGDVSGKGMDASLLMAKTASLFRYLGKSVRSPAALLQAINSELCETNARGMFVTMAAGLLNPNTGRVRLANAGHEPPLLSDPMGGFISYPADSPPLGILDDGFAPGEIDILLGEGALFLFSDGVTESLDENGKPLGAEGVQRLILATAEADPKGRVDAVLDHIAVSGSAHDDLTLVAIASRMPVASLVVPAKADQLKLVRALIDQAARNMEFSERAAADVVLAVDEACQNIIRHAYGPDETGDIRVSVWHNPGTMVVELRDFAAPIDPSKVRPRDLDDIRPGGLGTYLMASVMDRIEYLPPPGGKGNLLRMTKAILKE